MALSTSYINSTLLLKNETIIFIELNTFLWYNIGVLNERRKRMSEIDKIVNEVNGSMAIEGMPLTDADKERIRISLSSKEQFQKILRELILKHSA
jgi:hypothetical protein